MSLHPGPGTGLPPEGCPSECSNFFYSPFFLLKTTLSLPVGCWREAVLPGLGSGSCREINKAFVRAERSAQPDSLNAALPILSPQSATGVQGKGCGGQGSPPRRIFPIHSGSACHPERALLHSAGLGVWGIAAREPQDLGAVGSVLCVGIGGRHVPFCVALAGGPEMEGGPLCFSLSAGCSFRLHPGRSIKTRHGRARPGRAGSAQAWKSARIP